MKKYLMLALASLCLVACGQVQPEANSTKSAETSSPRIDWDKAGPDAQAQKISFEQVKAAVADGAKFYDVRSPKEFQTSNFGITENFPVTDMEAGNLPDVPKDTPIYLHCQSGRRSADATKILREAGFSQVYDLGGLAAVEAIGGQLVQ